MSKRSKVEQASFLVRQTGTSVYIHYSPSDEAYVGLEELAGAATFTLKGAKSFLSKYGKHLPGKWEYVHLSSVCGGHPITRTTIDAAVGGKEEQELFDATHPDWQTIPKKASVSTKTD